MTGGATHPAPCGRHRNRCEAGPADAESLLVSAVGKLLGRVPARLSRSVEEVDEQLELGFAVVRADLVHRRIHARKKFKELGVSVTQRPYDDGAPVDGISSSGDPARTFESVQNAGHGCRVQPREPGDGTRAERPVAQLLQGVASQLTPAPTGGARQLIEDVVPLPDDDPRGSGFASAALPMVIGGMVIGIALSFAVAGVWRRVGGAVIAAAAARLVVTLVTQGWLGALVGNPWANAAAVALTVGAISMTLIGLVAVIGIAGIPIGAIVMFLLGNQISAVTTAPELLPTGWGSLGQLLPPDAGGTLLRSTSFFDGAAAGGPILVLAGWLTAGLLLAALGRRIRPQYDAALTR